MQHMHNDIVMKAKKGVSIMGKKKPGIYRTTISISADLKRRIDKAGEDVNWSAIAARAFESKLADIAAKKEKKNMDDVIQRLRASRTVLGSDEQDRGYGTENPSMDLALACRWTL
jgi:hypothetical protein